MLWKSKASKDAFLSIFWPRYGKGNKMIDPILSCQCLLILISVTVIYISEIPSVFYGNATQHVFSRYVILQYVYCHMILQINNLVYTYTYISLVSMTNKSVMTFFLSI